MQSRHDVDSIIHIKSLKKDFDVEGRNNNTHSKKLFSLYTKRVYTKHNKKVRDQSKIPVM